MWSFYIEDAFQWWFLRLVPFAMSSLVAAESWRSRPRWTSACALALLLAQGPAWWLTFARYEFWVFGLPALVASFSIALFGATRRLQGPVA